MNENINLCELLKGHEGETFYSTLCGNVILQKIGKNSQAFPIHIFGDKKFTTLTKDGRWWNNGECVLFPSKEQRDWNKWVEQQKQKVVKTWSELEKSNKGNYSRIKLIENIKNNFYYSRAPIEDAVIALIKIHQLIEVGYGGNITNEEWENEEYKHVIYSYKNELRPGEIIKNREHIAFHTSKQRDEFLSYPENVQLVKDFYMI